MVIPLIVSVMRDVFDIAPVVLDATGHHRLVETASGTGYRIRRAAP